MRMLDGKNANGTPLQVYKCASGNKNQRWAFTSNFQIQWAGTNKCIDLTGTPNCNFASPMGEADFRLDGKLTSGTKLQIWTCSTGNANQEWDIDPVATS